MPFTNEQLKAINDQNKDILVSASAGSGKTTVLVQRVLKKVLNGTGVDELLVVTFTKAAAEEMKERIKRELRKELQKNPKKRNYLRRQLNLVDTANISTIDSFCLDVIRRFYYTVDLDPSFSILTDETQTEILKERALHDIEGEYLENDNQDFISFYDNFAGDRDVDSARDLLLDLYNFAMAKPNYREWLRSLSDSYDIKDNIVDSALWQNKIKPYLLSILIFYQQKADQLLNSASIETKELEKIRSWLLNCKESLDRLIKAIKDDESYNILRTLIKAFSFNTIFQKGKNWDEDLVELKEEAASFKSDFKEQIMKLYAAFFVVEESGQIAEMKKGYELMKVISNVEISLIDHFNELKREENMIDYNDMEQLAYQIQSQDTSNSHLAREFYQNKFKEILIDEYQDINALQESIIQSLKNTNNHIFMVGDVKQSIYGFRQAEPSLFLEKYNEFGNEDNSDRERILLSDNFRSTKPVTKTVNQIFNTIMTKDFGGIDYQEEAQLTFGASYYPDSLAKSSEIIYHKSEKYNTQEDFKDDYSEINMVSDRINQFKKENLQVYDPKLGQTRPFKYSDIAILTRSKTSNLDIMQSFAKNGIPLYVTDADNYFQTFELTVIMNYLKIIDNPDQDIPLVTVLRSPLFNFKETDLAKIRINSKNSSFYNALSSYVTHQDELSQRVKNFLNQLEELREIATNSRISELIWSIYEKTNLLEIMTSLPNGEQRRVNLEALYERASSYESAGFKGLYQFINFIERIRRSQKDLAQPLLTKEAGNAVNLMTIHHSKGLEFPIVFYLGAQRKYQMQDLSRKYIINSDDVGLTIRESKYFIDTLIKSVGNLEKQSQLLEEETRILYVALTRAKQKLIIVADIDNFNKKVSIWNNNLDSSHHLPLNLKLNSQSSLEFMGPALAFDQHLSQKISEITHAIDEKGNMLYIEHKDEDTVEIKQPEKAEDSVQSDLLLNTTKKLYNFNYSFKDASRTTAYQAVSEIKRAFNDPIETELENSRVLPSTNRYLQPIDTKPNFLFDTKFTGAEIGTATHLILQYYDYAGPRDKQQLDNEIEELILRKKLNPDIVSSLHKDQIEWFTHSDFVQKFIEHPQNLKREVDFSSLISANKLFENFSDPNAKILVHGTIDGYYIDKDGIILFDYKTDHIDKNHLDLAIDKIKQKYAGQLRLYEQALNSFSNQKVKNKYLILLDAKKVVEVK